MTHFPLGHFKGVKLESLQEVCKRDHTNKRRYYIKVLADQRPLLVQYLKTFSPKILERLKAGEEEQPVKVHPMADPSYFKNEEETIEEEESFEGYGEEEPESFFKDVSPQPDIEFKKYLELRRKELKYEIKLKSKVLAELSDIIKMD